MDFFSPFFFKKKSGSRHLKIAKYLISIVYLFIKNKDKVFDFFKSQG
jgi:hypothetical protein